MPATSTWRSTWRPHPRFTRTGADLQRELPLTLAEALLGAEVPVRTLKGRVLLRIPRRDAGRPHLPPHRPGHAPLQGRGLRRPARQGPRRPARPASTADDRRRFQAFADHVHQPDPRQRGPVRSPTHARPTADATGALDAHEPRPLHREGPGGHPGRPAPRHRGRRAPCSTPSTSWPPCSTTTRACPPRRCAGWAPTCQRLRMDLAAALGRRAQRRGQLALARPRAPSSCSSVPRRRRRGSRTSTSRPSTCSSRPAESGGDAQRLLEAAGAGKEALLGALASVRGGQRVTSQNPEAHLPGARALRPRPDRATRARASSTRSSAATRRSAASSRCSAGGPRTTPS